ncbi:hypothetical protein ElyMa_001132800 [Elysia marginata]|uniref:Uncharacterized protein n=1 Tax=Elysia marginata TaxID=1093978 RepID=A0AAV4I1G8_9GAST|nr:hypothetical protein ElyMa_001132800 [Elysia marginata]
MRGAAWQSRSASNSRFGGRGIDCRPCHVAIAFGKQFTLTFPSPLRFNMGTQLEAIFKCVIFACNSLHMVTAGLQMYWSAGALVALLCGDTNALT